MRKNIIQGVLSGLLVIMLVLVAVKISSADSLGVNFETSTYATGSVNGQDGWTSLGSVGSGCAIYDHAVALNTSGFITFGDQSLRISNAVTSGCFGDQTFAKPLVDSVGEIDATAGSFSEGTRQTHFEMQFDIASTQVAAQPGLFVSVSPDRGDGSRMSYIGFEDTEDGIDIIFYDVQGTDNPANFVLTPLGTFSRETPHTIKLTMDMQDGASNDVVRVWIDGSLVRTGTSWENYYRYDSEASAEQSPRIVKTVIFRTGGTAVPANDGKGFLFDNLSLQSLTPVAPSVPEIISPLNNAIVTVSALTKIDWTDSTGGTFPPFEYQYQAFSDAGYTSSVYLSGWLTNSEIPTPGTPPADYYVRVRARDAFGTETTWSNGAESPYKITVIPDPVLVGPPTDKNQCKIDGWKIFNNPTFKNQGDCVSYVQSSDNALGNKAK